MPSVIILSSPFLNTLRARQEETNALLLGHPVVDYVKKALAGPSWTILPGGLDVCQGGLLVINEACCGLDEDVLYRFYSSDQLILADYQGTPGIVKVRESELASLKELGDADFDTFFDAWTDMVQPEEVDPVVDELFLDVPVVDSYLLVQLAEKSLAQNICYDWIEKGVRIDEPTLTRIAPEVVIGAGTWIQGNVRIMGETKIGSDCLITDRSDISDSTLGDQVTVRSSVIEESVMEEGSNIGPYSHLRPHAVIGPHVHIGNFVEVKKATLGEGTKAGHLAYIGDADVGKDVNISCGVIFCNYDGKNKHHTVVGDHAFLGSNANLVAPVELEDEAFVAAGSTITKKVEQGALAVERAEQKSIPGYVAKRKAKGLL